MARLNLPYPNGWFAVSFSHELAVGEVKRLHFFGEEFVAFRGEDGTVRVLDAYCAHLGAHLGVGGTVEGNAIRCPFHGWKYNGETGDCVDIPYAKKIPPKACVKTWPVMERNGMVLMHHHTDGAAPTWDPEIIPELDDPSYILHEKKEWELKTHPQEVMENGVDITHFQTLHSWKASAIEWEPDGPSYRVKIHVDTGADEQAATAANATEVNSYNSGPGLLYTRAIGVMTGIVINCLTPIEPERLKLLHVYYYHKDCDPQVWKAFFDAYWHDWTLDIDIWERKIYRPRPVLAEGDGQFSRYRKWYRQFYSEMAV